ncbi:hypothetical protein [Actinoplanes sp. NPDC051494]|uniref:hypothetical protein n=1 Tax=Actinoplanes sp. NPDC051494 TaxID=3363907 RepID=UPI00378DC07F
MDGAWHGLLFDNPAVRLAPALTWSFRIPAGDGDLELDWLPVDGPGRHAMAGREVVSTSYAEPGEAGYRNHRFDRIRLLITGQDHDLITVTATVSGDIDGLGRDEITVTGRLAFTGITVQLSDTVSGAGALARLAAFTDVSGLREVPDPRGIAYRFSPDPRPSGQRRRG